MGYDRVFSPTFLMETKLGWNQIFTSRDSPIDYNVNQQLGLKGVEQTLPGMAAFPVTGYAGLGLGANIPNLSGSQNRQAIVNMTSIHGTHTLKWGVNLNWIQQFLTNPVNAQGSFTFNGEYTRDHGELARRQSGGGSAVGRGERGHREQLGMERPAAAVLRFLCAGRMAGLRGG